MNSITSTGFNDQLEEIESQAKPYLHEILDIVQKKSEFLDGNMFYVDIGEAIKGVPSSELKEKRRNIAALAGDRNEILEIGFNAGHSALLMLLANSESRITVIDNCQHNYTENCFSYLSALFPGRLRLIIGDSTQVIDELGERKFDLIHYDGGKHLTIEADLYNTVSMVNEDHVLVIDDTQNQELKNIISKLDDEGFIESDKYKLLTAKAEKYTWKHLIATFRKSSFILDTSEFLAQLGSIYNHKDFSSIYTNNENVNKVTGYKRARSLCELIYRTRNVEGDFVECGVAAGHSSVMAALAFNKYDIKGKSLFLFDTYAGFNFPLGNEVDLNGISIDDYDLDKYTSVHTSVSSVSEKIKKTKISPDRVHFIAGLVQETIPVHAPKNISVLRLDVDLYEPTKHCLEELFPLLSEGGYLIIDDYGHWQGCKRAVDEYFYNKKLCLDDLIDVDYTCKVYKKKCNRESVAMSDINNDDGIVGVKGGAWDKDTHNALYPGNFNEGLAKFIVDKICPTEFLEFGSGLGLLASYVYENADVSHACCIEPNGIKPEAWGDDSPTMLAIDIFSQDLPDALAQRFNLVVSIEVAEHVSREKHDFLFDFLVAHSKKWIVFSGGRIGQGGHGHIAERSEEEWKSEFIKRGMIYEDLLTREVRSDSDAKNVNHKKNLLVFSRPSDFSNELDVTEEINTFKDDYVEVDYRSIYAEAIELQRIVLNENVEDLERKDEVIQSLKKKDLVIHSLENNLEEKKMVIQRMKETIERKENRSAGIVSERNKLKLKLEGIQNTWAYKIFLKKRTEID